MIKSNYQIRNDRLTFKKWKRKNYSLFQTLHRVVIISVLAVVYFISTPALTVASDKDTSDIKMQYDIDEVEVSAQRAPAIHSQIARILSVIDKKEIEAAPVESVQELLEYIVGVDIRQRGLEGVQADISIRGGTFDQQLILLNGVNITDPQTGHHNLNLPVSLQQIERIEVLEGPAARVYGPNAFSGAINIITRVPTTKNLSLSATTGSYKYFNSEISGSFFTGDLKHIISLNRKSSNGYIDNTDFLTTNLFYSNLLEREKHKFTIQVGLTNKGFGANSFYTPKYPNQFEEINTLFTSAKWITNSTLHITPVIYWRRQQDRFELFRNDPPPWYPSHNYHLTNVYGTGINSWFSWGLGKSSLGAEFRSENILSNVLGELLSSPKKVPGEDATFIKSDSRNIYSAFIEHTFYYTKWIVSFGFMGNIISGSDLGINTYPGVEINYNVFRNFKMFGSINTSLRMPSFTDLYYSGPTNVGNPELKPERSATVEGGAKWNQEFIDGHWVVFYRKGRDIIDWTKETTEDLWQPRNITRLNSLGSEMKLHLKPSKLLGSNYPESIELGFYANHLEKNKSNYISNYVLDNLKYKFTGSVTQPIFENFNVTIKTVYQDREGTYTQYISDTKVQEADYKPFWLIDCKLRYRFKGITAFFSANNLFNTFYFDIGNVVQPGRWMKTGISYDINFE